MPDLSSFDKRSQGQSIDTIVLNDEEATNFTYFIGVHLPGSATSDAVYTLSAEIPYVHELVWDPGLTHEGTEVFTNTSPSGGNYFFRILPENTSVGAWRTALNVQSGEAHVYLREGSFNDDPNNYFHARSERVGSDGFVLHSSQFAAGQAWYLAVVATPGAQWTLVSGEAYVLDLGTLAPFNSTASSANVTMGAEGMRFFRTAPSPGVPAWRLYLNGATNEIFIKKTAVPHPYNNHYELRQSRQMLVVPDYLVSGEQYIVGVLDAPGTLIQFDSREQEIIDVPFLSTNALSVTGYGYVTYRISVPVQQIAWLTAVTPTLGNANISVRRDVVPNEVNNDAFSEVAGATTDSISLVPPTLTDGTFLVTVWGLANYTATFTSGNPVITDVAYISTTVNNDPSRVGWRYYRVPDINSQLGSLGWDLFLQSQPTGTEIALRRNAVPGRWNFRQNNGSFIHSQGYVDYSGPDGFIQRPGHQADIWYIGIYSPALPLGSFVLNLRELTGPQIAFDGTVTNVTAQPTSKFYYWRVDVPPGVLGWDVRVTNVTSGDPRLVVTRDALPGGLGTGPWLYPMWSVTWPSGFQWSPYTDWTELLYSPSGANDYGRILAVGMGNPLEPGTYYVGVINESGNNTPMSYTFVSRGIGTGLSIPVPSLAFSNGVANVTGLAPREAAYFQVTVPTDRTSWKMRLSTNVGESLLIVQKDALPNIAASANTAMDFYGGHKMKKAGNEEYLLLPAHGETNIEAGTYYLAVVSEGRNPNAGGGSRIGTNTISATLNTFGSLTPVHLGTLSGPDLTLGSALAGGEIQTYTFDIPSNVLAMEVTLENRTGEPHMTLRPDAFNPTLADSYGNDGGTSYVWQSPERINVANPAFGRFTLALQAIGSSYSNATYTVRVRRIFATPVAFDGGMFTMGAGHLFETWRYYSITVPSNVLGWDLRLTNATSGDPYLVVRRDLAPDGLSTHANGPPWYSPTYDTHWNSGYQWAPYSDWTGYTADPPNGANRRGQILQMGMGNPLEPGTYIVGVINSSTSDTNVMRYTLVSRGIGSGLSIPVAPLAFTNGVAAINNLPAREVAYFSIVVPTNVPSWQVRLATNSGESSLILQKDSLPNIDANGYPPYVVYGGREMQKFGHEHYLMLPPLGESNIVAGTYYAAVVSEGHDPGTVGGHIGSNSISATLQSIGVMPVTQLGTVSAGSDLVLPDVLEGGAVKAYQFNVAPGTLSMEVHLDNRTAKPSMTLRPDGQLPEPYEVYGNDGGQNYLWQGPEIIVVPNPSNTTHTLVVMAENSLLQIGNEPIYSNATYTVRVHAVGAATLAFDGGSITVTDHEPDTWRYYLVTNVPANAFGWDVRLTNVTSGDPRLVIRRATLPDGLTTHTDAGGTWFYPQTFTTWPTGYQWSARSDWTDLPYDADGTNRYGHTLQMGMANPLEPGSYYIGVFNGSSFGYGADTMSYTLSTRGIGTGFTIPITPLAFAGGSATNEFLPLREAAYYSVDVPSNAPNWKIRLAAGAGDSLLLVQQNYLPNVDGSSVPPTQIGGGVKIRKVGNEHYVMLPDFPQTNIVAGRYYLLVASEGLFPYSNRAGTNGSSYLLQSIGPVPVDNLGAVSAAGVHRTNSVEGGEFKIYRFSIPDGLPALEVRLDNRVGNPDMALRRDLIVPYPRHNYGYNGGVGGEWGNDRIITIANPTGTNYTLVVQGGAVGIDYPDADYVLRVAPATVTELAFDPSLAGCVTNGITVTCTNATYCGLLADDERAFYHVQVPALLTNGTAPLAWRLKLSNAFGNATLRLRKNLPPTDVFPPPPQTSFDSADMIIVPPLLAPGSWYVEVRGSGSSSYCLSSSAVELDRAPWNMPGIGEPITTPGLTSGPLFGDSGVNTNGVALPGDGGIDLEQGAFHYYAVNVPANNGALFRMVLEAISGNPDLYIRRGALPTLSHEPGGYGGSIYERSLTGNTTEYGNWVPDLGRYEATLQPGVWYIAVRASGASNCRYRLKLSTGTVTELALGGSAANHVLAAGDWRYYRFYLPTNAPTEWMFTFQQHVGDVLVYVRDTIPPGQYSQINDYRDWSSFYDNKNNAGGLYRTFDTPGTYTNRVPPLRPGHFYYLGFRALSDATFSVSSATNTTLLTLPTIAFYGGTATNYLAPGQRVRYRIDVPSEATRWISTSIHDSSVKWYLEQGSMPTETDSDHSTSGNGQDSVINQSLLNAWPWMPQQMYFLVVSNSSPVAQPFFWRMDGRNCCNDDNDNDQLPDCWELTYWPGIFTYSGDSDPDNDGNSNWIEYQDGTNPTNATSMLARLTLLTHGPGSAGVAPGPGPYPYGTTITLTATPTPPDTFLGWTGTGVSSTNNPLNVVMTTNRTITATFSVDYGACGSARADYRFQGNLVSSVSTPPDLAYINAGHVFTNQLVDGAPRTTLRFPLGSGLRLDQFVSVVPSNNFTIVMLFKFDSVSGYRRILDFKNASVDAGLYAQSGALVFYPVTGTGGGFLTNDTWHQVVLTRDASGTVIVYSDGVQRFIFNDTSGYSLITAANLVRFFKDDGGEDSGGSVARIRVIHCVLSEAQVTALDRAPSSQPIVLSDWGVDSGGKFIFKITGPSGPLYRVEGSQALTNWTTITNISPFPGTVYQTNSTAVDYNFFRVLVP